MASSRFLIRSVDRDKDIYPSASNFKVNLGDVIPKVTLIKAVNLTLPMTLYNITDKNNSLTFEMNELPFWVFRLAPGKYSGSEIREKLRQWFDSYVNDCMWIQYDDNLGKMKFVYQRTDYWATLNFDVKNSIADILGYKRVTKHWDANELESDYYTWLAENLFDTTGGVRLIYITVDFLDTTNSLISTDEDLNVDLFIAVPIQWDKEVISVRPTDLLNNSVEFLKPKMIQSIHFKVLTYHDGSPHIADFHGIDWFIELFFDNPLQN